MSITLSNLSIGYTRKTVASGLNATFNEGELTCLLGPNGIGKSTLLRTMMSLQKPLSGEIIYCDERGRHDITAMPRNEVAKTISIVITEKPDADNLTVAEIVGMGRNPYTGFWGTLSDEDRKMVAEVIETVGMTRYTDTPVSQLSDGELQKVMTAKSLAQSTPIMLLDEPTSFLDFQSKVEMMSLLKNLAHDMGKTIILSTHDLTLANNMADKLWWMESTLEPVSKERLSAYLSDILDSTVERS